MKTIFRRSKDLPLDVVTQRTCFESDKGTNFESAERELFKAEYLQN